MTPKPVTAGWSLPSLVDALARAGWGVLHGRQGGAPRNLLRALAQVLPDRSATGLVSANQLADMSGLSSRWTRSTLAVLERAGIITWTRGGIIDGKPRPSLIRVSKRALASLVNHARRTHGKKLRGRAASFARRLADELRGRTILRSQRPAPRRNAAAHAELKPTLSPLWGRDTARVAGPQSTRSQLSVLSPNFTPPPPPQDGRPRGRERLRQALRKASA